MSAIRSTNTKPEVLLRKNLFAAGYRYRIGAKEIPGKPDIVLPKYKAVVFVNGCFWHGHGCKLANIPKSNQDFWLSKIKRNLERDKANIKALNILGLKVLIVWECALVKTGRLSSEQILLEISKFLSQKFNTSIQGYNA